MAQWLKCQITKGMFSDERNVVVQTTNGENYSFFVPQESTDEKNRRVRVRVLREGPQSLTLMPDEHQSVIVVHSSELLPA